MSTAILVSCIRTLNHHWFTYGVYLRTAQQWNITRSLDRIQKSEAELQDNMKTDGTITTSNLCKPQISEN